MPCLAKSASRFEKYVPLRVAIKSDSIPFNLPYSTVAAWTRDGLRGRKLPHIRVGGRLLVDPDALRAFAVGEHVDEVAADE
jgi:hypothetical protein